MGILYNGPSSTIDRWTVPLFVGSMLNGIWLGHLENWCVEAIGWWAT